MERDLDLIAEDLAPEREAYERHMADELEAELRAERRAIARHRDELVDVIDLHEEEQRPEPAKVQNPASAQQAMSAPYDPDEQKVWERETAAEKAKRTRFERISEPRFSYGIGSY